MASCNLWQFDSTYTHVSFLNEFYCPSTCAFYSLYDKNFCKLQTFHLLCIRGTIKSINCSVRSLQLQLWNLEKQRYLQTYWLMRGIALLLDNSSVRKLTWNYLPCILLYQPISCTVWLLKFFFWKTSFFPHSLYLILCQLLSMRHNIVYNLYTNSGVCFYNASQFSWSLFIILLIYRK